MNLQAIITTNSVGCAALIILMISSYLVRQRRQLADVLFTLMIVIAAVACIVETVDFIIDGKVFTGARTISMILNSYLYTATACVSFIWCIYADMRLYRSENRLRTLYPKLAIPVVIQFVAVLLNFKFQFLFSIGADNVYHREIAGYSFYLMMFFYFGFSVVVRARYYKKFGKTKFFPIWMFLVPIICGAVSQLLVYGISLGWCSVSLGLVGIYMCLQNELSYIDPLTKLYNRNYLDQRMRDLGRKKSMTGGIMIDIDDFKKINDIYGHSTGDDALVDAASIIKRTLPDKAVPIRFAGDEFIILVKLDSEAELDRYPDDIRRGLDKFNEAGTRSYTLSFSIGTSIYGKEGAFTVDDFLNSMDANMYVEKNRKHSRSSRN